MAIEANQQPTNVPSSLMQLDILLPSQHFVRGKQAPEQRLMIAVLHDALDCLEKYRSDTGKDGHRLFREAKHWFLTHEAGWPYSFECICAALDLDSNAVRRCLGVTREAQPAELGTAFQR
jgi:hypothetical protein